MGRRTAFRAAAPRAFGARGMCDAATIKSRVTDAVNKDVTDPELKALVMEKSANLDDAGWKKLESVLVALDVIST